MLDRGHDVADPGEMEHVARAREDGGGRFQLANVVPMAGEVRIPVVVRQVSRMAADEVVDDPHGVAPFQQQIHHVGADEAGPPGHDGDGPRHAAFSFFMVRML